MRRSGVAKLSPTHLHVCPVIHAHLAHVYTLSTRSTQTFGTMSEENSRMMPSDEDFNDYLRVLCVGVCGIQRRGRRR